ncbi:MAG: hypothetical protein ABIS07_08155 [Dokdonella sp.]
MRDVFNFRLNQATRFDRSSVPVNSSHPRRAFSFMAGTAVAGMIALSIPPPVAAQTCVAPLPWPTDATSLTGNSCFGTRVGQTLCGGEVANPGLNVVYRIYVSGDASEIDSMSFNFIPVMYLSDENHDCASGPCLASGSSINLTGLAPGYYRLIVAHSDVDTAAACGLFTMAANTPLSETDVYFENGFE